MKQLHLFDQPSSDIQQSSPLVTYWKLAVDGAARNNPGPAGAGLCIKADDVVVEERGFYLGKKTNNQAEYYALLLGLFFLKNHIKFNDPVLIISDSLLLVRQVQGAYKVKAPELQPLHAVAKTMLKGMSYTIEHVMREYNTQADEMANKGIDDKIAVPDEFKDMLRSYELHI
jgi:ribonuclease HI